MYNIYNKDNNLIDYSILLFFYPFHCHPITFTLSKNIKVKSAKVQKRKSSKILRQKGKLRLTWIMPVR